VAPLGDGVTALSTAYEHTCAVVEGDALCWGSDLYGQYSDGGVQESSTPMVEVERTSVWAVGQKHCAGT
jgi:hypothetical protein